MKKIKLYLGITGYALMVVTAFTALNLYNNNEYYSPRIASTYTESVSKDGIIKTEVHTDKIAYNTVKGLSSEAKIVIRGEVIKKSSKTRNLAKNPLNPKEDALDRKTMSQEYEFKVSKWLKGTGEDIINIVYPEYTEIDGEKISEEEEPLIPGQEYILFLSSGVEGTYYGAAEPWQFKISSGKIEIKTKFDSKKMKDIKNNTTEELESLIK